MNPKDIKCEHSLKYKNTPGDDCEWSIDEVDKDGKIVCKDQVPCKDHVYFYVTNIIFHCTHEYPISNEEHFSVDLDPEVDIGLFGCSEPIEKFCMLIKRASENDNLPDYASAHKSTEYSDGRIDPSFLQINIYISDKKFDELKELVRHKSKLSRFEFIVKQCKGFYSDANLWFPARHIRILTPWHKIEIPDGCEDSWKLGYVESCQLVYSFKYDLASTLKNQQIDKKQEDHSQEMVISELQSLNSALHEITEDLRLAQASKADEEHELKKINSALVTLVNKQEDTRSGTWHIHSYIKHYWEKFEQQNENHYKLISILNSVKYSSWAIVLLLIFILFKL